MHMRIYKMGHNHVKRNMFSVCVLQIARLGLVEKWILGPAYWWRAHTPGLFTNRDEPVCLRYLSYCGWDPS